MASSPSLRSADEAITQCKLGMIEVGLVNIQVDPYLQFFRTLGENSRNNLGNGSSNGVGDSESQRSWAAASLAIACSPRVQKNPFLLSSTSWVKKLNFIKIIFIPPLKTR